MSLKSATEITQVLAEIFILPSLALSAEINTNLSVKNLSTSFMPFFYSCHVGLSLRDCIIKTQYIPSTPFLNLCLEHRRFHYFWNAVPKSLITCALLCKFTIS